MDASGSLKVLCVNKDGGISIPASYTSHVCPISTSKLYNQVSRAKKVDHLETVKLTYKAVRCNVSRHLCDRSLPANMGVFTSAKEPHVSPRSPAFQQTQLAILTNVLYNRPGLCYGDRF